LLERLIASGDPLILQKLPNIIAQNPMTFVHYPNIYSVLAASPFVDVKVSFLDSFIRMFTQSQDSEIQRTLLDTFNVLLQNSEPTVVQRLTISDVYRFFTIEKLLELLPAFADFTQRLKRYRDIGHFAYAFIRFPPQVIRTGWRLIVPQLLKHFCNHVHPLGPSIPILCSRLCSLLERPECIEFLHEFVGMLAGDPRWAVRKLAVPVIAEVSVVQHPEVIAPLIAFAKQIVEDAVQVVANAALESLEKLREYFGALNDEERENEIYAMILKVDGQYERVVSTARRECHNHKIVRTGKAFTISRLPQLGGVANVRVDKRRNSGSVLRTGQGVGKAAPRRMETRKWPISAIVLPLGNLGKSRKLDTLEAGELKKKKKTLQRTRKVQETSRRYTQKSLHKPCKKPYREVYFPGLRVHYLMLSRSSSSFGLSLEINMKEIVLT
jgi:hypothetical protein